MLFLKQSVWLKDDSASKYRVVKVILCVCVCVDATEMMKIPTNICDFTVIFEQEIEILENLSASLLG